MNIKCGQQTYLDSTETNQAGAGDVVTSRSRDLGKIFSARGMIIKIGQNNYKETPIKKTLT